MPRLSVAKLLANAPIDPEAHLDAARVERYAPLPAVVFDTPEGLLLADGYHRLVAAQRGISPEEAAAYIERYARDRRVPKH